MSEIIDLSAYRAKQEPGSRSVAPSAPQRTYEELINEGVAVCDKDPQTALSLWLQALSLQPNDPVALFNVGIAYHDLRSFVQAQTYYEACLRINPEFRDAYYNLARVYRERAKECDKAFENLGGEEG